MTFIDLKKRMTINQETQQQRTRFFDRLDNRPFWIWDIKQHKLADIQRNGDCCFNHIIGLPKKNGLEKPLFDYEKIILDCLKSHNHIKYTPNSKLPDF